MLMRRICAALSVPFVVLPGSEAAAQISSVTLVGPTIAAPSEPVRPRAGSPDFRMPDGDLRRAGAPDRSGLIAAYPVQENLQIGIGRFVVPELARPRTNMEREQHPTAMRGRERGIAAVGFSLRF